MATSTPTTPTAESTPEEWDAYIGRARSTATSTERLEEAVQAGVDLEKLTAAQQARQQGGDSGASEEQLRAELADLEKKGRRGWSSTQATRVQEIRAELGLNSGKRRSRRPGSSSNGGASQKDRDVANAAFELDPKGQKLSGPEIGRLRKQLAKLDGEVPAALGFAGKQGAAKLAKFAGGTTKPSDLTDEQKQRLAEVTKAITTVRVLRVRKVAAAALVIHREA